MAPMARDNALIPHSLSDGRFRPRQNFRETSWQFAGSETRSERELSEEPPASNEEEPDMEARGGEEEAEYDEHPQLLESPEDHEDILHPLREAADRIGREVEDFAEALDRYNPQRATASDEQLEMSLDLIEIYHQVAVDTVKHLREEHAPERRKKNGLRRKKTMRGFSVTQDDDEMDMEDSEENDSFISEKRTTLQDLERWEQEAQTWDLLKRLVVLRFSPAEPLHARNIHQYSPESEIWEDFLETDELALERKTILQWLKDSANESGEEIDVLVQDLQQNADRGDIIAHGWLHTKAAIKNIKRLRSKDESLEVMNASRTELLVTSLDPDAPTRQGRKLEAQDEYFERAIWLGCYEMLRRGKSSADIKEWCMERTEVWRAISMSGFPEEGSNDEVSGSSALWRRMCFALARRGGGDEYERAVYGILSGDIQSVEPVCRSWDDFVFVHYNALLRSQFDHHLQTIRPRREVSNPVSGFGIFDAVQFHGAPYNAARRLVETLRTDRRTSRETTQPMKMLQGVLLADQFPHFIYQQGLALSKFANASGISYLIPPSEQSPEDGDNIQYVALDDHDSLRVLTHVLLVFMALGVDLGGVMREIEVENVIVAYISFLRFAGKEELIPLYCSQLSGKRIYAVLCRNLIDVTDHEQRTTQIKLMRELGLDAQEFVGMQARFLLADSQVLLADPEDHSTGYPAMGHFHLLEDDGSLVKKDFLGAEGVRLERIDTLLIRSLEWYLLVDGLWSEVFYIGSLLYLRFYKHMHLSAARELASRLPSSTIAKYKTRSLLGERLDFAGLEASDEDLTERMDGSGEQKRLLKKHLLAASRTFRELEAFIECLDRLETVSSLAAIFVEDGPGSEKEWRAELAKECPYMIGALQPILKGWLLTSQSDESLKEYKLLRATYLPETILGYVVMFQFAGQALTRNYLMECMELSTVIAEEDSDLLSVFLETGRIQELVEALAMASKTLLLTTSAKANTGSRSKQLRLKGWSQELWNVKP